MRYSLLCVFAIIAAPTFAADPVGYPNRHLLIEAEELKAALGEQPDRLLQQDRAIEKKHGGPGECLLIDVRPRKEYEQGAIADAVHVDAGEWVAAFGDGSDQEEWTPRVNRLVWKGKKSTLIVYDDTTTPSAARVWWILKYWGVEDARILNGGLRAWRDSGGGLLRPPVRKTQGPRRQVQPAADRLATAPTVKQAALAIKTDVMVFDARSVDEYRAGAIPTARHLDWRQLIDSVTGKVKTAKQLQALFDAAGVDLKRPTICYCQSGARSSMLAFVLELMGGQQVANYHGSWNEWSRLPNAPVALPRAAGVRP